MYGNLSDLLQKKEKNYQNVLCSLSLKKAGN
jgi:hypothetical protein